MAGTTYKIVSRKRQSNLGFADIQDFSLAKSGLVSKQELLEHPNISLYSLDLREQRAVFVETPPEVSLSDAPFYWLTQHERAIRVMTLSFDDFLELMGTTSIKDSRVNFIYSTGRAGSTLASQIFASVDNVETISEPDALTILVAARHFQPEKERELKDLLDASVRFLCKSVTAAKWVIKGRSQMIEVGDWLYELYPQAKNVFLYRDAETWLTSAKRAFLSGETKTPEQQETIERTTRAYIKPVTHLVAKYPEEQHLTTIELLVLTWLSSMDACVKMQALGMEMLPIRFLSWHSHPEETAMAMMEYCDCLPSVKSGVLEVLSRDSQADTLLSQENTQKRSLGLTPSDLDKLTYHLQQHTTIRAGDFQVSGTLNNFIKPA